MIDSLVTFVVGMSGGHAALAIVLFTLAVRVLLLPLSVRQARSAKVKERLAPELRRLQKRFGRDPQRLSKEVSALYAREGSSPFAGILPGLAQLPFLWLMYQVATHPTALAGQQLLGVPLGQQVAGVVANYGLISWPFSVFAVIIALVALVAWLSSRKIRATLTEEQPETLRKIMPLLPWGSVVAAAMLPLAAGLYLLVSTAWTFGERAVLAARVG
ncbi:YidC/Oxa1 family membrane protein insertase [Nonomuraea muscovyensis]|uniref:Membrane protein insertase YidC n=1 Tax=Nonomuraea muscovyensis TaxID=1124761 RepID=A0A7X0EYB9_9ACTN|nr:membrane protein insertase YidC [Nonomuraea muscovyensis]MBB6346294.1 YidC/Oxa1 family membrane protein insertase [Nonomuraea muscovyensis]